MAEQEFSSLARVLLQLHHDEPRLQSYGSDPIVEKHTVSEMDAAYEELLSADKVEKIAGSGRVIIHGEPRTQFRLKR